MSYFDFLRFIVLDGDFENIEDIINDFQPIDNTKRFITDSTLERVLTKNCGDIADLDDIAKELGLITYSSWGGSFKKSYKNLANAIAKECSFHFAMVEGLHRIYTVRNVLEGRLSSVDCSGEPYTNNRFLQSRIKTRMFILDKFTEEALSHFQELSLFIMKVKKASVERTIYDELCQFLHEIESKEKIVNLVSDRRLYKQTGGFNTTTNHVLYEQRVFIYKFITSFALNNKKSTVLYKFQSDHLSSALTSQHIPNKYQFLGLDSSISLNDKDLFSKVKDVILDRIGKKAEEFTTLCTRESARNNCWSTKPLSQEIRVVLSYYVLASLNMETMKSATDIFSPLCTFKKVQTQRNVRVIPTMYKIVLTVDNIVDLYKKSIKVTAEDIHSSKITQMLQMNLFKDIIECVKEIGHNSTLCSNMIGNILHTVDDVSQDSSLIELIRSWYIVINSYIQSENEDVLDSWKEKLIETCKGPKGTKTHVRKGIFGSVVFAKYSVPTILLFSTFVKQVESGHLNMYSPIETNTSNNNDTCTADVKDSEDDKSENELGEFYHIETTDDDDEETVQKNEVKTRMSVPSPSVMPPPAAKPIRKAVGQKPSSPQPELKRKASGVDGDDNKVPKAKRASKVGKKMFDAPNEVFEVYKSVIEKERKGIPVELDIKSIKDAWIQVVSSIKTGDDLSKLWLKHKEILFYHLNNPSTIQSFASNSSASVVDQESRDHNVSTNLSDSTSKVTEPASTPSSISFSK